MREQTAGSPSLSHVVVHNIEDVVVNRTAALLPERRPRNLVDINLVPAVGVDIEPGGVLFRLVLDRAVTTTGMDLDEQVVAICGELRGHFAPSETKRD
jgi:hypothetical protein